MMKNNIFLRKHWNESKLKILKLVTYGQFAISLMIFILLILFFMFLYSTNIYFILYDIMMMKYHLQKTKDQLISEAHRPQRQIQFIARRTLRNKIFILLIFS